MADAFKNPAFDLYQKADTQLEHLGNARGYYNCVVPGHTEGGAVDGFDLSDPVHRKIVIVEPGGEKHPLDLANVTGEELSQAAKLASQGGAGKTAMETRRNRIEATLRLLSTAQQRVAAQHQVIRNPAAQPEAVRPFSPATSAVLEATPMKQVTFVLPGVGHVPVRYDTVEHSDSKLILGVRSELAASTFFPSAELSGPFPIMVDGRRWLAHDPDIRFVADGADYCVLLIEEVPA